MKPFGLLNIDRQKWRGHDKTTSDVINDVERQPEQKPWQKQPTLVAKRNARERTRVRTVNQAFVLLKLHLPSLRTHTKRVSKLKILNAAILYIHSLVDLIKTYDANAEKAVHRERRSRTLADCSLIQHQPLPYMQSLLDHSSSYLYTQAASTTSQGFIMNTSQNFLLPTPYPQ